MTRGRHAAIAATAGAALLLLATTGYAQSITTLSQVSLASDMVFSDGSSLELATMSGTVAAGLTATLTVAVAG